MNISPVYNKRVSRTANALIIFLRRARLFTHVGMGVYARVRLPRDKVNTVFQQ